MKRTAIICYPPLILIAPFSPKKSNFTFENIEGFSLLGVANDKKGEATLDQVADLNQEEAF